MAEGRGETIKPPQAPVAHLRMANGKWGNMAKPDWTRAGAISGEVRNMSDLVMISWGKNEVDFTRFYSILLELRAGTMGCWTNWSAGVVTRSEKPVTRNSEK